MKKYVSEFDEFMQKHSGSEVTRRQVTHTKKDKDGDILAICNPESDWKKRSKDEAIRDIDSGNHEYFVKIGNKEVDIKVLKYLRTDKDTITKNNLAELDPCDD
jgi:Protein of unknown function (DUF3892)